MLIGSRQSDNGSDTAVGNQGTPLFAVILIGRVQMHYWVRKRVDVDTDTVRRRTTALKLTENNQGSMTKMPVGTRFPPAGTKSISQGGPSRWGRAPLRNKASSSSARFAALVAIILTASVREVGSRDVYEDGSTGQSLPGEHAA